MKRRVWVTVGVALSLLLGGCAVGKRSLLYEGEVPGHPLAGEVTVVRDEQGVPHIFAEDAGDLFFALGYTMAQDRLFHMDFTRRLAQGRLCEWFGNLPLGSGARLVQIDMLTRCFELGDRAAASLPRMPPESRRLLERFTDGVNRFVREAGDSPPVEYRFLRVKPQPWTVVDVMSIPELYGMGLSLISLGSEILHEAMTHAVGPALTRDFYRRYTGLEIPDMGDDPSAGLGAGPAGVDGLFFAADLLRRAAPRGSNNWAVSASRSATGLPMLASDPHVPLGMAPSFWYHANLQGDGFAVVGMLYTGYPAFGAGFNGDVAWGVTNVMADQIDLVRERLDPEDSDMYETAEGWKRFETRPETIAVRFGRDRTFTLRKGDHGFLVPREAMESRLSRRHPWVLDPVSLQYVATDPAAYFHGQVLLMRARDSADVNEALEGIGKGPTAYNYVWACRDGDIGYRAAGRIPIREGRPGFAVADGWKPGARWGGTVPLGDLPAAENPPEGILVTANEKIVPEDYPWHIGVDYASPHRADRIRQLLGEEEQWTAEGFMRIQADVHNRAAPPVLRVLEEAFSGAGLREGLSERERRALDTLLAWDLETSVDSVGAAIFGVFFQHLLERTFADELGKDLAGAALKTNLMAAKVLMSLLDEPENPWFNRTDTEEVEDRDRIFREAFRKTVKACRKEMGRNQENWSWGRIHTLRLAHPFGLLPLTGGSFRIGTLPYPGDNDTVNGGYFMADRGRYPVVVGAASRMVVDLAHPGGAWFNCSTGMAGEPHSPYFSNLTAGWYHGQHFWTPLAPTPDDVPDGKRLVLNP